MSKKNKKALLKPLIQHLENVRLALVRWVFTATYSVTEYLSRAFTLQVSTTESFKHIKESAFIASLSLGEERGEAPDMRGTGLRNSHLLAIAPNASSSIICGGTSPSIEPSRANVYTHKTLSGSFKVKNKYLEQLLESKDLNNEKTWRDISAAEGSVEGIEELSEEEKAIFKTAPEINQMWVVDHAHQRQKYICQSQSVNLFFVPPKSEEPQEVHDEYLNYVNSVHWAGANKLKSMYYLKVCCC